MKQEHTAFIVSFFICQKSYTIIKKGVRIEGTEQIWKHRQKTA